MPTKYAELRDFVDQHAVKRGRFTLASGQTSDFYIDGKLATFHPEGLRLVVAAIRDELRGLNIDGIGGLDMGATPIVAAYAIASGLAGTPCPAFVVRKQTKEHGTRKLIEGVLKPGGTVAIVDDVVTSGGSILTAIRAVREVGCEVAVAITIVDRESGATEAIEAEGVQYRPLLTISDLGLTNVTRNSGSLQATHR